MAEMMGAPTGAQDAATLDADGQNALNFAKAQNAVGNDAVLESYRTQVVQGAKYYFKFKGVDKEVIVWSKPWENFHQVLEE